MGQVIQVIQTEGDVGLLADFEMAMRGGGTDDAREQIMHHCRLASSRGRLDRHFFRGEPVGFIASIRTNMKRLSERAKDVSTRFNQRDVVDGGNVLLILDMAMIPEVGHLHGYRLVRRLLKESAGVDWLAGWTSKEKSGLRLRVKRVRNGVVQG